LQDLLNIDARLTQRFQLSQSGSFWWKPAVIFAHSGDSWIWAIGLALVWLVGNPYWHRFAAVLEISIILQALLVFAIKSVIRRQRPEGQWGSIYRQFDPHSFPSGHATRAVLLAVLAASLGPVWFGVLICVWAPLVCFSRVLTGLHYFSDILGGMLLGLLLGLVFTAASPLWLQLMPSLF
jgi:undecaprenyl-diphosphatase